MGDDVCFFVNFVENLFTMGTMNREIFHIALPAIVANVTVPLLGLVDTAIAGHLGAPSFIGGVAVGTMMFNLVYWNRYRFGLRLVWVPAMRRARLAFCCRPACWRCSSPWRS